MIGKIKKTPVLFKRAYILSCKLVGSRSAFFTAFAIFFTADTMEKVTGDWAKVALVGLMLIAVGIYFGYISYLKVSQNSFEIKK